MANWQTIPDASVNPGAPVTTSLMRAMRDNPLAIIEGAAGAPKIQNNAFADNSISPTKLTDGTSFVTGIITGFGIGNVGAYAILGGNADYSPGDTAAGSALTYAGLLSSLYDVGTPSGEIDLQAPTGASPAGTWRCQGITAVGSGVGDIGGTFRVCLWQRVA